MKIEDIARVAHEMNRAYCQSIGDDSQPEWNDAPEWQKESAIKGVEFHMDNPRASAAASHESWLAEKEADGWKYGEVKDPEKKEHPCFVPFDQLSVEQQAKDFIFRQTVHSLCGFDVKLNQHNKIKGYRQLSDAEIALVNMYKDLEKQLMTLLQRAMMEEIERHAKVRDSDLYTPDFEAEHQESMRWINIARTDLQKGVMAAIRAVTKPK